jgi:acyl-CoA thioester hydrolase
MFFIDSIINTYLIKHCHLNPLSRPVAETSEEVLVGLMVSSYCHYFGAISFPSTLEVGLRVEKMGNSSVTYEVGVFVQGTSTARAVGGYTHVFVRMDTLHQS